jgi:DNA repair protein RecO (recombination protein O)
MRLREPAICLRTTDYSETSQVLVLLTRDSGIQRLLAKGSKRPKSKTGGAIDLLSEGQCVFIPSGRGGLGTMVEFTDASWRPVLRQSAGALGAALYMIELAGAMLAEADPHPEVFDLLHGALERLDDPGAPVQAVLAYFQWRLLKRVGLLGELRTCAACGAAITGRRGATYFSSRLGGLVCRDCEGSQDEKYLLDGATLAGLAAVSAAEGGARVSLPPAQARAVNRLLAYHIAQQLGRPLKAARRAIG